MNDGSGKCSTTVVSSIASAVAADPEVFSSGVSATRL
jgi:hypothetical protein